MVLGGHLDRIAHGHAFPAVRRFQPMTARGAQLGDLCCTDPPVAQRLVRVLVCRRGRLADLGPGATEARGWPGLHHAIELDEGAAGLHVRVLRRFRHRQHGREADFGSFHDRAPLVPRLLMKLLFEARSDGRPTLAVMTVRRQDARIDAKAFEQGVVELRLVAAHGDPLAVGGLVDVIPRRTRIEPVRAALVGPQAGGMHAVHHRHQARRAVDHRRVDHLSSSRRARFEDGADQAERQVQGAAAEIADQVERRNRRSILAADGMQRAGQGDVVDVVPGCGSERAVLAPTGHPAVDQLRIEAQAIIGAEAQPFCHARPKALDDRIGAGDQPLGQRDGARILEVHRHGAATAVEKPMLLVEAFHAFARRWETGDTQNLGAHLGKEHRGERTGADAPEFHDPQSCQRAHFRLLSKRLREAEARWQLGSPVSEPLHSR